MSAMDAATDGALDAINRRFLLEHPAQAAALVDGFDRREAAELLAAQQPDAVASVWRHLSGARIDELVPELPEALLVRVLRRLDPAVLATTLLRVSPESRERCLGILPRRAAAEVRRLMEYPPGSAGRVMDARVLTFRPDQTAASALEQLREQKPRGLRQLFVIGDRAELLGAVDIQDLAVAEPEERLRDLARPPKAVVSPFDDRELVAERLKESQIDALPVIDVEGRLIGVIRHAALLRTLQEEASLDIQMMVGAGREERALSPVWLAVKKRLPWLQVNQLTAFAAATVVGFFEDTIAQVTALAVLMPVVAGQSGNAGAQALAVTMRGLALREVTTRHWLRVLGKELRVGLLNGLALAATTAAGVLLWSRSVGLAAVIAAAMVVSMTAAGFAGSLIPITLTRLGQDPAQASSIILTTVTDIAGFLSFLGIATLLASWL
ncbi:MAG TPA: magnesium transporter [Gammaproteobacteria bacterium]